MSSSRSGSENHRASRTSSIEFFAVAGVGLSSRAGSFDLHLSEVLDCGAVQQREVHRAEAAHENEPRLAVPSCHGMIP